MHIRTGCAVARKIADVLLQLFVLGITAFSFSSLSICAAATIRKSPRRIPVELDGPNLALMSVRRAVQMPGLSTQNPAVGCSGEVRQELAKPVGTDAAGNANQGMSVALSADGSTAIVWWWS